MLARTKAYEKDVVRASTHPTKTMGIYDRDYYRTETSGTTLRGPRTVVGWLILINVIVYLADGLLTPQGSSFTIHGVLACTPETLVKPWLWWQLLTYGFAHAPYPHLAHIAFNMMGLWFLGRSVEERYGRWEFLRLYLVMIVLGGAVWSATNMAVGRPADFLIGASGAVTGVVLLFAVNFPRQTLLLFFLFPVPAWLVGVMLVVGNLFGHAGYGCEGVAYEVHLVGIAFAAAYYYFGWNLSWLGGGLSLERLRRRPKLRLHDPAGSAKAGKIDREVDRILKKISDQGEASLTRKERRTLEAASRQYQKNRHSDL